MAANTYSSGHNADWHQADVICGGFPCQDISNAGECAGLSGERSSLWKYLCGAIRLVRPKHAIVENVAALLGRGMGEVCGDLAQIGYDAEWHCIPASAVGAEHERDRIWIIANPNCVRELQPEGSEQNQRGRNSNGTEEATADALRERLQGRCTAPAHGCYAPELKAGIGLAYASSADEPGQHWKYQPLLGRGVHGIPDRPYRIKALGNAVVPQIPEIIGRAIMQAEGLA